MKEHHIGSRRDGDRKSRGVKSVLALAVTLGLFPSALSRAQTPAFTRITTGPLAGIVGNFRDAAWGDYDNDGDLDLVLSQRDGPNPIFENLGDGTFP